MSDIVYGVILPAVESRLLSFQLHCVRSTCLDLQDRERCAQEGRLETPTIEIL